LISLVGLWKLLVAIADTELSFINELDERLISRIIQNDTAHIDVIFL
jgi:hypothetical protein